MFAPGHTFDAGTHSPALAAAAWVGYYVARNDGVNAKGWEAEAMRLAGKVWIGTPVGKGCAGQVEVRLIGVPHMDAEDIEYLIEVLKIQLEGARRREQKPDPANEVKE